MEAGQHESNIPAQGGGAGTKFSPKSSVSGSASRRAVCGLPIQLVAGLSYCTMSTAMVLLNKHALSSFHFECPNSLLLFQCALAAALIKACEAVGLVSLERLSWRIVREWIPANFLFVAMIWTSFYALKYLNVAMVTVLKNLTNLVTICGDYALHGRKYPAGVWLALLLMTVSAVAGASTDMTFNLTGYSWQVANCLATAAYSLYLRTVMDKVQVLCGKTGGFDECSMVWYNNLLSIPFVSVLVLAFREHETIWDQHAFHAWGFQAAAVGSGVIGFAISFCSLWFLSTTTATTYSLTGSLNKIPLAIIGLLSFNAQPTRSNTVSILIGLLAGVVFGVVKAKAPKGQSAKPRAEALPTSAKDQHYHEKLGGSSKHLDSLLRSR